MSKSILEKLLKTHADIFLHVKEVVDAGMYMEDGQRFFVLFTKHAELDFDTWEAAEKHLNKVAIKVRWVTENERPVLSNLEWQDDNEDEDEEEYLPYTPLLTDMSSAPMPLYSKVPKP